MNSRGQLRHMKLISELLKLTVLSTCLLHKSHHARWERALAWSHKAQLLIRVLPLSPGCFGQVTFTFVLHGQDDELGKVEKCLISTSERAVWMSAMENGDINSTSTHCREEEMRRYTKVNRQGVSSEVNKYYPLLFAIERSLSILKLCKRKCFARVQFPKTLISCYLRTMTFKLTLGLQNIKTVLFGVIIIERMWSAAKHQWHPAWVWWPLVFFGISRCSFTSICIGNCFTSLLNIWHQA